MRYIFYSNVCIPQVQTLDETADRLVQTHPDQEEPIVAKRAEIDEAWNTLQDRVSWNPPVFS